MKFGEVCEHGQLKRQCPHCELNDTDKRIAELEAEKQNLNNCLDECRVENKRLKELMALVVESEVGGWFRFPKEHIDSLRRLYPGSGG